MNNYIFDETLAGSFIEPHWEKRLMFLADHIKSSLQTVDALCWSQYRMGQTNCAAIDLSDGADRSYSVTAIITGNTLWPDFPTQPANSPASSIQIDLIDSVEVHALLRFLVNHFNLTSTMTLAPNVNKDLYFTAVEYQP